MDNLMAAPTAGRWGSLVQMTADHWVDQTAGLTVDRTVARMVVLLG